MRPENARAGKLVVTVMAMMLLSSLNQEGRPLHDA